MTHILQNTTEHKNSKIALAITTLGQPHINPIITTESRNIVRGFLNGLGFETDCYISASLHDLQTAYQSMAVSGLGLVQFIVSDSVEVAHATITEAVMRFVACGGQCDHTPTIEEVTHALATRATKHAPVAQHAKPAATITKDTSTTADKAASAIAELLASIGNKPQELDENKVIALIKQHALATEIKLVSNGEARTIPAGIHHKVLPDVIKVLDAGCHVYMVGGAGSGKTTIAEQAAKALGLEFYFNGALDSEYKLTGFIDAQGRIVSTAFRKAYESGGVYLFDEIDASLPSALLAFNAALANGHSDFPGGCVKKHPDFKCIAAANTYGKGADRQYVGRNQLDSATLDRFVVIEVNYDEKLECALAGNDDWVNNIQKIRKAIESLKIRHIVSPRASIMGAKLLAAGMTKDFVMDSVVWKGLDADSIAKIKNAA